MNLQTEKLEIMKLILETDNISILEKIKFLFVKEEKKDFWTLLPKEQQEDILKGIEDIENDNVVDYFEYMKKHQ